MAVNKVEIMENGSARTIIDLTEDTVEPEALAEGYTAHDPSGQKIIGKMPTTTVLYTEQTLTNEQKAQARENIGAVSEENVSSYSTVVYGTCSTAAATSEKAIMVDNENWELSVGSVVMVRFDVSNSASNVTLNVNGTGAYPIWYNNAEYTSTGTAYTGYAKRVIAYMFNGTHWVWITSSYDANTTYKNVALGHGYATCSTAAATAAKVGTLASYALTVGGIVAVKFTNAVPANATLNINSKGAKNIFYRGAKIVANVIKADDIATFIYDGTQYQLLSIDRWQEDVSRLQKTITDHKDDTTVHVTSAEKTEWNNKQPKGDYALKSEVTAEKTAREQAIAELNARLGQQTVLVAEGSTQTEAEEWLETNGDKSKVYLMPDETFWQYKETTEVVEGGATYTNLLPQAKATDRTTIYGGDYNGDGANDGYKTNTKLSGSGGGESTAGSGKEAMCSTGFIFPVADGDKLRIKNAFPITGSNHYVVGYDSANARTGNDTIIYVSVDGTLKFRSDTDSPAAYTVDDDGTIVYTISTTKLGANFNAVRICMGIDENTIITLNEEIKEGGGTTTIIVEKWASTGHGLVATDYDVVIANLNNIVTAHTEEIAGLRESIKSGLPLTEDEKLEAIKTWDVPIYDAHIPVFELTTEKSAVTESDKTVSAVYAKYDALMAKHPSYITKTDLGMCSDGVTPVYRYDFRESEPHRGTSGKKEWSETKTKAIIVSGIHWEWGGIFSLYNAFEEIAENPKLFDLRRNTHLIVLPVCNPYAVANMSVRNANLVEIHRNFEVDFIYPGESGYIELGERSHGGTEPLSEVETQYIDNIFKANTDSALFLTCHSNQSDTVYGTGFTWASPATYYMCNLHYRLVDKLSKSWMNRFGEILEQGIADYKTENLADGDTRLGSAYLSTTNGTETKQATKYGIQATNVEVCDTFWVHGTKANPEPNLSSFTISRGAETYINFFLTALGVYDYKDKEQYYK